MAEIAFEYLVGVLEAVKGTAISVPTHYLNMAGVIAPRTAIYRPSESRGYLAEFSRSAIVRKWSEWEGEGPADVYTLPFLLEMLVKGAGTIATPGGGTLSRTHTYTPTMTSDDILSGTLYWGDPNVQVFQSAYCMVEDLTISADASSEDGVSMSAKGFGQSPDKTAPDSTPTQLNAPLLAPSNTQIWMDTTEAIGTTEVADRVISAEVTIPSGVTKKWIATGPTGGLDFYNHGRKKRHAEAKLTFEVPNMTQYDLWAAGTVVKTRIRFNGPVIEGSLRHYIQVDLYSPLFDLEWGEFEESNRTLSCSLMTEYNTTATHDFAVVVQSDRTTI